MTGVDSNLMAIFLLRGNAGQRHAAPSNWGFWQRSLA